MCSTEAVAAGPGIRDIGVTRVEAAARGPMEKVAFKEDFWATIRKTDHALNIEGLAAKNGTLYFGFREPAKDKNAYVVSVSARQLFSGVGNLEVTKLKVGGGRGIRDLLSIPEGFLPLIGPDDDNSENAGMERRVMGWVGLA